jgi:hypothetical protein
MQAARAWGTAWLALTTAFALHVWDEAANDFLALYNPAVLRLREQFPMFPLPTFTFSVWLGLLLFALVVLALLSKLAFLGKRGLKYAAYPYAAIMFLNGAGHIGISIYTGRLMAGVLSSPLLLIGSIWLFLATMRAVAPK